MNGLILFPMFDFRIVQAQSFGAITKKGGFWYWYKFTSDVLVKAQRTVQRLTRRARQALSGRRSSCVPSVWPLGQLHFVFYTSSSCSPPMPIEKAAKLQHRSHKKSGRSKTNDKTSATRSTV
jgi:hypothetical protein